MDIIEKCNKCKLHECINCEHSWSDIQEIKQKLAEKDKTIKQLKLKLNNARHKVCEEIRECLNNCGNFVGWYLTKKKLNKILDKFEGEE